MADTDKTVSYGINADASGFQKGMQDAAEAAKNAVSTIDSNFKKVQDAFGQVQKQLLVLAGIVAGGAFFKEAISASNQLTGETLKLSKALGINAQEAGVLNTALNDIGSSSDAYVDTFTKFARQLKSNEEGLKALGLQTRDSNGNLRDANELFTEALRSVSDYKAGLDQNTYAQTVFGKSIDEVMKLQKLNNNLLEDARKKNQELGLTITQENVAASKAYKLAMNDVGDVLLAIKKTIGDAVMPVFTELGHWFAEIGPTAVTVFQVAMRSLSTVVQTAMVSLKQLFVIVGALADPIFTLGRAIRALVNGDMTTATKEMQNLLTSWGEAFKRMPQQLEANGEAFRKSIREMWSGGTPQEAPKGGNKTMGVFKDKGSTYNTEIANLQAQEAAFRHNMDAKLALLEQEAAITKRIYGEDSKEYANVQKRIVETRRSAAEQIKQIALDVSAAQRNVALAALQAEEQEAKLQRDMGNMTQLELLQKTEEFENRRSVIAMEALKERERIALADPDRNPVEVEQIHQQIEESERQHQLRLGAIRAQQILETTATSRQMYQTVTADTQASMARMIQGTQTLSNFIKSVWQSIGTAVSNALAKIVMNYLKETAVMAAVKRALAIFDIGANAAQAGAGAAASAAETPVVGWLAAPVAAASTFAMASAFAGNIPAFSAAGGFDIPASVNPIIQAHAREMVLPAKHADVIRSMAEEGGTQRGGDVNVVVQGRQYPGNFFMMHRDDLVKAIQSAQRDFAIPKK